MKISFDPQPWKVYSAFTGALILCAAGVVYCDAQLNDPSQPAQLGGRLKVTAVDLTLASTCARDVVSSQ